MDVQIGKFGNLLQRHLNDFRKKVPLYGNLWNYYDGDQPLVYSADRLREVFPNINADFTENWAGVVVDALLDRLILLGFEIVGDVDATDEMLRQFNLMRLDLLSQQVHLGMLVCGESFLVVTPQDSVPLEDRTQWKGEEPALYAFPHDPRSCSVLYSNRNPAVMVSALKWWVDEEDGYIRAEMYTVDSITYLKSTKKAESIQEIEKIAQLVVLGQEVNNLGIIPVLHFRRDLRRTLSELKNVIPLQDAINKLATDLLIAAEFAAFKQKWIISNADLDTLRTSPGEIWDLPAGDGFGGETKVGEFTETNLMNYIGPLERKIASLATISRTPPHYFGGFKLEISGEALKVLEGPLIRKAERIQASVRDIWRRIAQIVLAFSQGSTPPLEDIDVTFGSAQATQPLYEATVLKTNREAGVPLVTQLRTQGWSQKAIDQLAADQRAEQASAAAVAATLIQQQRTSFDRGTSPGSHPAVDEE